MTLKELKDFIRDLPEVDYDDEPYEVFVEDTNLNLHDASIRNSYGDVIISLNNS